MAIPTATLTAAKGRLMRVAIKNGTFCWDFDSAIPKGFFIHLTGAAAIDPMSGSSFDKRFRKSVRDGPSKPSPLGFLQMPAVILPRQPANL
jgi:hypothetical protein